MITSLKNRRIPKLISVIAPVYNEEEALPHFFERVYNTLKDFPKWEMIFVDDGSKDKSVAVIRELQKTHKNIKLISFSRNYGHQTALIAGYEHAFGEVVITLDSDGQHPPEFILELLDSWSQGYFIVFGRRGNLDSVGFFKRVTSAMFYKLINRISSVELQENVPDFRLMDQQVVKYLRQFQESRPFLRGIISDIGFTRKVIDYQQEDRRYGESKYTLKAMLQLALSGIMSFSPVPLRLATYFGILISFGAIGLALAILMFRSFFGYSVDGVPSILVGTFFMGGVQLICLGILGEYVTKLFFEVKKRPRYCIQEFFDPAQVDLELADKEQ
ncbi:MAG: hypothetical protein A2600_08045 [Candidatus Lambdaproteobacteria bacterium RIFOXYD1_FULL_56_27]|uniref:Glycosyltransferase 2-like domain-containing protein n=1 Tax=Candidatus Lambdaproteobacteria bacterium RIFOXYD2_FULL_56_26 TaxID=1817773 RepID=A0A1F6GUY7_9PROT|nr:MAG: hypothetical protein A2426_11835 [Candidatus Lambdaproteobacteria bacterium RIFOXYC1_FULL_56_13]OGH01820.1 MAG: hypothetical protein A2557_01895 [Candidatus Lambdaproteobacteria bacterium RIFOXYD2_FULL_56_26]OGH07532.1 MAG: hypothetical protein A2600_08045 [Candidatus Lambdaproteobacteria bacterium RIFOXYD1_FULL_56_27]